MSQIRKDLFKGVIFTALGKYSNIVISLVITAVLARLLTPADFGIVAIATVIINFFSMLSDMGIGPAIIQNKNLNHNDIKSIYSFTFYIGLFLGIIFYLLAPIFTKFYNNKDLIDIVQILSISIFFHCVNIVPHNLIIKSKNFSFIAYSRIIIHCVSGIVSIVAAFLGLGIYSLLIQPIMSSVLAYIVDINKQRINLSLRINLLSLKKIYSYSMYQFLFSFINYFSRNLDKLVVGKIFGVNELGYYEKSYRLMMLPIGNLSLVITPAIQPIFSEFQNDKKLLYHRSLRLFKIFAFLGFPLSVFLFFCSKELIIIIYGNQWSEAIPIFQILSLSVGFQMIFSPQGTFFQSANAVKEMFYCGIVTAIFNVISVVVGCLLLKDINMLSWMIVLTYVIAFFVTYYIMVRRVFCSNFISFLKVLINPIFLSIMIALPLFIFNYYLDLNIVISLLIKCAIFVIIIAVFEITTKSISKLLKQ